MREQDDLTKPRMSLGQIGAAGNLRSVAMNQSIIGGIKRSGGSASLASPKLPPEPPQPN